MNNDFGFTSEAICQYYWQIASRVTQKSLFTVTNVLFYFLHAILCPWTHNSTKNNYQLLISPLSLRIAISDLALWCHYSWSVTSRERGLLALCGQILSIVLARANWRKCDLHKRITTVNIDFSPLHIHGFACKKLQSCTKPSIYSA